MSPVGRSRPRVGWIGKTMAVNAILRSGFLRRPVPSRADKMLFVRRTIERAASIAYATSRPVEHQKDVSGREVRRERLRNLLAQGAPPF